MHDLIAVSRTFGLLDSASEVIMQKNFVNFKVLHSVNNKVTKNNDL